MRPGRHIQIKLVPDPRPEPPISHHCASVPPQKNSPESTAIEVIREATKCAAGLIVLNRALKLGGLIAHDVVSAKLSSNL